MHITINEELRKYIDPLTDSERVMLERSLLAEGCRDALVLWGEILIDGHNRYEICRQHGIAFNTVQNNSFETIEQVMLWMIDNQLSRRSVTDFQRGMLALRKQELLAAAKPPLAPAGGEASPPAIPATVKTSRKNIAQIAGVSSHTIAQIEKIQKTATPELIDAVRAGTISIGAATAVASLASDRQVAAVAGGKKELRQVARQVREAKAPPKAVLPEAPGVEGTDAVNAGAMIVANDDIAALKATIAGLSAENLALKEKVAVLSAALEDARRAA